VSVGDEVLDYATLRQDLVKAVARLWPRWLTDRLDDLVQAAVMRVMQITGKRSASGGRRAQPRPRLLRGRRPRGGRQPVAAARRGRGGALRHVLSPPRSGRFSLRGAAGHPGPSSSRRPARLSLGRAASWKRRFTPVCWRTATDRLVAPTRPPGPERGILAAGFVLARRRRASIRIAARRSQPMK
jgi:hypothetical protein